ncbi:hypothetical protein ACNF49_28055 [Actinomadura sp. ATCC 39365]|uniref:hypothetical protein n=1 Tax=Nonomuraea sp. NPDC005692 TaxID=3157168 RepID=UPI0033F6EAF6
MSEYPTGTGRPAPGQEGTLHQGKAAAQEVAGTARDATVQVAGEARAQTRRAVDELRDRVRAQSDQQSRRAAQSLREWSEDLAAMHEQAKPDSPVTNVVRQAADQGRRAADYLDRNGLTGVVSEVQSFARRRPAAFLAGALAAGFLVGRIIKASGDSSGTASQPATPAPPADPTLPSAAQPGTAPPQPLHRPLGDPLGQDDTRPVPPLTTPPAAPAAPAAPAYGTGSDLP